MRSWMIWALLAAFWAADAGLAASRHKPHSVALHVSIAAVFGVLSWISYLRGRRC